MGALDNKTVPKNKSTSNVVNQFVMYDLRGIGINRKLLL